MRPHVPRGLGHRREEVARQTGGLALGAQSGQQHRLTGDTQLRLRHVAPRHVQELGIVSHLGPPFTDAKPRPSSAFASHLTPDPRPSQALASAARNGRNAKRGHGGNPQCRCFPSSLFPFGAAAIIRNWRAFAILIIIDHEGSFWFGVIILQRQGFPRGYRY